MKSATLSIVAIFLFSTQMASAANADIRITGIGESNPSGCGDGGSSCEEGTKFVSLEIKGREVYFVKFCDTDTNIRNAFYNVPALDLKYTNWSQTPVAMDGHERLSRYGKVTVDASSDAKVGACVELLSQSGALVLRKKL
jgi:hypothetical protein